MLKRQCESSLGTRVEGRLGTSSFVERLKTFDSL